MENIKKAANMTTVIVFIVAFLLGYGTSARIVNRNRVGTPAPRATTETNNMTGSSLADISTAVTNTDTTNNVLADDQPAGTTVAVSIRAEKEAWVAVHEDAGGKPGKILGAQIFPAGTHLGKIELLRGTEAGKKYYAMLHADDGDRAFDYETDMPLKDAAGDPVMHAFMAGAGAAAQ